MSPTKKYCWIILAVWAAVFLPHLEVLPVNIMEARNFVTAREMITHNNWLLTTMNLEPRYEKPPLPTLLTAISGKFFGFENIFALRLPAVLTTLLLLFFFFKFNLQLKVGSKIPFLATLILATSFYIIFMGRHGQWDIFTHAFMLAGIYYLWLILTCSKNIWKNVIFGSLCVGAAILSKGPVALYALLLPFLIAFGSVYRFKDIKQKLKPLAFFILLSLILGASWFLFVRLADPEAFIEITIRETTRWTNYNVRPFYYYWSFFTQSGIWSIPAFVALLYPYLKNRVANKKAYKFSLFWTLSAVILLSLIPEKKSRYLLPVLIPLALTTAFYIEYLFKNFKDLPLKEKAVVCFNHSLIASLGIIFPIAGYFLLEIEGFWFWYVLTSLTLFGIGFALLYFLKKQKYPPVFYLTVVFICGISLFGFPLYGAILNNPESRSFFESREFAESENLPVYVLNSASPEIVFDYGEPIPVISEDNFQQLNQEKFGLLAMEEDSTFVRNLHPKYLILSIKRFDLNYVSPQNPGYKNRLIRRLYVLKKRKQE